MRNKRQWNWDSATVGMQVVIQDRNNAKSTKGVVKAVGRSAKRRIMDGRPVQCIKVANVTILCDNESEIVISRDDSRYQLTLK